VRVELSDEADAQVAEIDAWWRENRLAAPDLFADELERALDDLARMPTRYDQKLWIGSVRKAAYPPA